MQSSDKSDKQAYTLALMVELCNYAGVFALQKLEREENFDVMQVFEAALLECLKHNNYNKDDLATVWAMLQLGSRAIRKFSLSTDHFDLGPSFDPPALVQDPGDDRSSI